METEKEMIKRLVKLKKITTGEAERLLEALKSKQTISKKGDMKWKPKNRKS